MNNMAATSSLRADAGGVGKIWIFDYAEDLLLIVCPRVLYKYNISSLQRWEPYSCNSPAIDWQQHYGRTL